MYIKSDKVEIFPTPRRNGNIDNNSRFNTEQNITELTNRLVGNQSYIVSGLDVEKIVDNGITKYKITAGECIINGYYFNLSEIKLPTSFNTESKIYFKINKRIVDSFEELININGNTDTLDNNNYFNGLEITSSVSVDDIYLLIAETKNLLEITDLTNTSWLINLTPQLPLNTETYNINYNTTE